MPLAHPRRPASSGASLRRAGPPDVRVLQTSEDDGARGLQNGYRVLSFMERTGMEYTETQMHAKPLAAEGGTGSERNGRAHGETDGKLARLARELASLGHIAIAFSGGVDSTFLAAACARTVPDRTLLIHAVTPFVGTPELESCAREATRLGLPIMHVELDPLSAPEVAANPSDRCYRCKRLLMGSVLEAARAHGCDVVLDGSNADDAGDYRPGMRAVRELGIRSPLMDAGWTKAEERSVLRAWGHEVWDLPAGACLATRVPCGEALTATKLDTVRACEDYLHDLGLPDVRVRLADGVAQVEANRDGLARIEGLGDAEPLRPAAVDSHGAASDLPEAEARAMSDALPEPGAVAEPGGVALPPAIVRALMELGPREVRPLAIPYRHGAMNGASPTESNAPKGDA